MAMFACITGNRCDLAEQMYDEYLSRPSSATESTSDRLDTTISTLYLRALLQQGKWDMAMGYLSSMERTSDESTRPNEHTLNILLQYQVIGSL